MNRILPILTITILLTTCSPIKVPVAREVKTNYPICYEPKNIHADRYLRLDGYYSARSNKGHNVVNSYMFYNDGSVVMNIHGNMLQSRDDIYNYPTTWGMYYIENDIITTLIVLHNFQTSTFLESKFKIINSSRFIEISTSSFIDNSVSINDTISSSFLMPFNFKKLENKPDSFCWLKKEKWFWCNKEEWKTYMKEVESLNR